jgi:hypothetical protein
MIKLLKKLHRKEKDIEIVTARTDFDDQFIFYNFLLSHGIDINKIHVRRVGNMGNKYPTPKKKAIQINKLIKENKYTKVYFYDDDMNNINEFLNLAKIHTNIKFTAFCIVYDKEKDKLKKIKYNG